MPQILVVTDSAETETVVYREWVASTDLESPHFAGQLVERVGWAIRDAKLLERDEGSLSRSDGYATAAPPSPDRRAAARR